MIHVFSIVVSVVRHRCGVLLLLFERHHAICVEIRLKVMEAWDETPGHLQASESVSQRLVVSLPEILLEAVP